MPEDATQPPDGEGGGGENQTFEQVKAALKRSEKREKDLAEQAKAGAAAQRELAFVRAGVDLDNPVGQLFAKAYDGELDKEAIGTAWTGLGVTAPPPPPSGDTGNPPPSTDDLSALQGLSAEQKDQLRQLAEAQRGLASNASPPGAEPQTESGQAMMDAAYHAQNPNGARARPQGGMGPRARDAGLSVLFERAKAGDETAVFKAPDESWADATDRWRTSQR
jgi:hypothetical protein